ncbi:hypothetical protein C7475_10467 [Chitinophaga sp. S165]|nr:hypothetical protein C7475_10467 [Chitinophaga sp. S165]
MTIMNSELGTGVGQLDYKNIYKYVLKVKKRQWIIIGWRDYC